MVALIKFLLNNIILVITPLAALITIISWLKRLWLKRLCKNSLSKLSKSITLPVYVHLIFLFVVVVVAALAIKFWPVAPATPATKERPTTSPIPVTKDRPKELQIIKGESFGVQRITLDGKHFELCIFDGTEFVYLGEAGVDLVNCSYKSIPIITFGGSAAATLYTLTNLYATPEFRPKIEATFEAIKTGKLPLAIPPSDAADGPG